MRTFYDSPFAFATGLAAFVLAVAAFAAAPLPAGASMAPVTMASGLDVTRATILVAINGRSYRCVLDTGTSAMLVSESVAQSAGLAYGAAVEEIAPDGLRYADHHTQLDRFSAGGYVMRDVPALISSKLAGNNVLCGYDFFAHIPTLIDRDRQLVTLFPSRATIDSMRCLPIDLTPRVPVATIKLNGASIDRVVLDSGMVGGGAIWSGVMDSVAARPPALSGYRSAPGVQNGMFCNRYADVAFYAGEAASSIPLCASRQRPFGYNGIVETNVPSVHQMAIDYQSRRLCFSY